ncbi:MAG: tRNA threonylcarbamoyladenosine dehydratase [Prevotella sp.]|nr:tRNA threonylcarbamoyladenosine dehydratase [Prevotella sp.]
MEHQFTRTQLLLGDSALETLRNSRVAVFGAGGVGGYAIEALARSGVGEIAVIDNDKVCVTNINRQIYALMSTIGQYKVDVAEQRIRDINPDCVVRTFKMFYLPDNADEFALADYDYVVDCIDTVVAKMELAKRCHALKIPFISSMGAANKMDAAAFRVADISKTKIDPLAKVLRKKLRAQGIRHFKVVYSEEEPLKPLITGSLTDYLPAGSSRRSVPASNAFVPPSAGLLIAGEVVKDLLEKAGTFRE